MSSTIVHIALGGCLRAPPVPFGITVDTGGHIAYVLAAAAAQASCDPHIAISLVTRRFDAPRLGAVHWTETEPVSSRVRIERLRTCDRNYLEKEALAAELPEFTRQFLARLTRAARLPSMIHAHFADAAVVALAARERFNIPFVYTPHALALDKAKSSRGGEEMSARILAERRAMETADAIVVSSRDEAERQLFAYGVPDVARRTFVIPPGVPPEGKGERIMPPLALHDPMRPMVLAIARPTFKKNLVALADAFASSRLSEGANLVILAGQHESLSDGAEEREVLARLYAIYRAPALSGRVALPKRHSSADVAALYRQAASSGGVFVNPALHEPFGLTLLEAAAAGLPVVATAHGGAPEIVRRIGHGLIVEPLDRDAISAACLAIIEDSKLRRVLSQAAAGYADAFSWEEYGRRTTQLYEDLAVCRATPGAVAA